MATRYSYDDLYGRKSKAGMKRYSYEGPVMEFDQCIAHSWASTTMAPSESKARSNLAYQFKQRYGRAADTKIYLPGKLTVIG